MTASEIASFEQFLGEHKRISKDLEKNPALVNDTKYLKKNSDLQDYLSQHTGLREELRLYPAYFMNRRNRYELSAAERTIDTRSSDRANSASSMTRLSQKDLRATDRFLEKHKNINKEQEKNPSLVADPHYLKKHNDFREFLEQNPDINAAIRKDQCGLCRINTPGSNGCIRKCDCRSPKFPPGLNPIATHSRLTKLGKIKCSCLIDEGSCPNSDDRVTRVLLSF